MKDLERQVHRVSDLAAEVGRAHTAMISIIAKSRELLRDPPPDTFLGRPIHEPIPLPRHDE